MRANLAIDAERFPQLSVVSDCPIRRRHWYGEHASREPGFHSAATVRDLRRMSTASPGARG